MSDTPWTDVWRALQELGAAIEAIEDMPDWLAALHAAVDAAQEPAEERAMEEGEGDE